MTFTPRSQLDYSTAILAFTASDAEVLANVAPTDLQIGGLMRAHVESLSLLLEENDQRFAQAIQEAISESCFNAFGFSLLPPSASVGAVVCSTNIVKVADITIPIGWTVQGTNGIVYQTTVAGVITAGQISSSPIPVVAQTAGTVGNAAAYTLTVPISPIQGLDSVTNPNPCVGGSDLETTDARAIRFAAFIQTLQRGTLAALEFAALSASKTNIIAAKAIEPFLLSPLPANVPFAGLVWLYYDDGTNTALPDPPTGDPIYLAIYDLVQGYTDSSGNTIPGYKAAGVRVDIYKVVYAPVYLRGDIRLTPIGAGRWSDIQTNLLTAAQTYFSQLKIGDSVSYQNLVTMLTDCDIDILQVNLYQWGNGDSIPAYGASMSAQPLSVGATNRGVLVQGSGTGPNGSTVTYPEWRQIA